MAFSMHRLRHLRESCRWRSSRCLTLKDASATQTVCKTQSEWRQCSESCCETAVVHVELARVCGPRTPQEFLEALEDIL